jgi:competence protein ComEA
MTTINRNIIYAALVFLVGITTMYVKYSNISHDVIEYSSTQNTTTVIKTSKPHYITIHLAGAVTKPGVYKVIAGSRILDVIQTYSETLETANLDKINLAKITRDGQRIYIPYNKTTTTLSSNSHKNLSAININTATQKQLQKIPGIGKRIAKELISYRKENGFFYSIKDILNVKYIGTKLVKKITPYITI